MDYNQLTYLPYNYFEGCTKLKLVAFVKNRLTAFPNFAPIGSSLTYIWFLGNYINTTIPKDAIAMHPNLTTLRLDYNRMSAFVISFCNQTKQLECIANNNPFVTVENPYRDCVSRLPKFKLNLTDTQLLPCDEKICWMKQHGFELENVDPGYCPDGREWKYITKEELCPGTT